MAYGGRVEEDECRYSNIQFTSFASPEGRQRPEHSSPLFWLKCGYIWLKCGYICVGRKRSDLIKLALRLKNTNVFIHEFQWQWTEFHKSFWACKISSHEVGKLCDKKQRDKLSKGGVGQIPNIRWWDFSRWRFGSRDISRDRKTNSFLSVAAFPSTASS